MKVLKVDPKMIEVYVNNSFAGKNHAIDDNQMLKIERDHLIENIMQFYPSILINEQIYRRD